MVKVFSALNGEPEPIARFEGEDFADAPATVKAGGRVAARGKLFLHFRFCRWVVNCKYSSMLYMLSQVCLNLLAGVHGGVSAQKFFLL